MTVKRTTGRFTRDQWVVLSVIGSVHFGCAICISLQAPFYPAEAERKGVSASEYGLVFGIFELVSFLSSPILGKYLSYIGPKFMLNSGIFIASTCSILFGLLDLVPKHVDFIALSFTIRIVEALGASAATTAAFAITASVFPDSVATTFAALEVFYGLGYIVGPMIGGILFSLGGYILPFVVMGTFLMLVAIFIYFTLPPLGNEPGQLRPEVKLLAMFKIPDVVLDSFCIAATAISLGFYSATLEPHLRKFQLTPLMTGVMFVISGTLYAVSAPLVGRLCDLNVYTKKVMVAGSACIVTSYVLVGPLPGLPLPNTLSMCVLGLVVHGIGTACILVPCFIDVIRSSVAKGFPDDMTTYGMVSGLWTSFFSLGAFVGPSVGGVLYDTVGFRSGTLFPVTTHILVFVSTVCFVLVEKRSRPVALLPQANPVDPEGDCTQRGRNLPQDIPPLLPSKCHDSITTGYGSFGSPAPFLTPFS
ncbi:MFS-type transporter SLC18B1-like [Zootermopsis nevadensis]|uniref:Putative MFS-type transporter n=1 Tax=Zootermopsis nevadensis TaxID=136037 RepID=A0A067QVJ6_ZOONE|nr:MFS-type transporter SLC18B1-like [Zootermopsis nevadensis]KDR14079.1 putative MFS-type transporter [Zootermopsis nevadensis]